MWTINPAYVRIEGNPSEMSGAEPGKREENPEKYMEKRGKNGINI